MAEHRKELRDPDMIAAAAELPPDDPTPTPPSSRPSFTVRQYAGAAITLVLAVVWLAYELRGDAAPPGLGQALVIALALVAGSGDTRPGGGHAA